MVAVLTAVVSIVAAVVMTTPASAAYPTWSGVNLRSAQYWDYCFDADRNKWDDPYHPWGTVQLYWCNGWSNQQWWANWNAGAVTTIQTPGDVKDRPDLSGPGKCLRGEDNGTVWIAPCEGFGRELWYIDYAGFGNRRIRNYTTNKCLDVGAFPSNGSAVWQIPCNTTNYQRWLVG